MITAVTYPLPILQRRLGRNMHLETQHRATGYIDDVAIMRWGRSTKETCNGIIEAMQKANIWAKRHALVFAPNKFQLAHHTRRRQVEVDRYI